MPTASCTSVTFSEGSDLNPTRQKSKGVIKTLTIAFAMMSLAACGGGGGGANVASIPVTSGGPSSISVSVTVVIGSTKSNSTIRTAATSTVKSVKLVATDAGSTTQAISNCTTSCSLNFQVTPGTVRFDGTLYDGVNATGNALATATTTTTIVAGQVNQVNLNFTSTSPSPTATPSPTPSPTKTPTPNPTSAPISGGSVSGVFSQLYSGGSPFHMTVAQHKASGAAVLAQSAMSSLWGQGVSSQDLGTSSYMFPIYVASASDPVKRVSCTAYGACNANGLQIHVPNGAMQEPHSDGHISIIDPTQNVEFDGWQCWVNSSTISCSWGGKYTLGGNGLANNSGSEAVHAGYAAGLIAITAQELLNGHIDHALGLNTQCLNNPTVYPADTASGADTQCGWTGPPSYGNLVHLTMSPSQIAATNHSAECKTILTALATYGAYTYDTGGLGLSLLTQSTLSYTALGKSSPWATTIVPHFAAAGEATGGYWNSCLNGLGANNFELLKIVPGA